MHEEHTSIGVAAPAGPGRRGAARGFTLAELLVVAGVIALLVAITLPALQLARRHAQKTQCAAHLHLLARALDHSLAEHGFYPLWDDGGVPKRYTWIDVLIQRRYIDTAASAGDGKRTLLDGGVGYCPADAFPDALNEARHPDLAYPPDKARGGVDYSYGIGVPLSAGGWAWRPVHGGDARRRLFRDSQRNPGSRLLAADAYASAVYNLSGQALHSGIWNDPTQFDNTVAWGRHYSRSAQRFAANVLYQDGSVGLAAYDRSQTDPVNTARTFVWYQGESVFVDPDTQHDSLWYPNVPPPTFETSPVQPVFPPELTPAWYTKTKGWTFIMHK